MYQNYTPAGNGMKQMFLAQIIGIISIFILFIPILGWIVGMVGALAGGILSLIGLNTAAQAHPNFRNAFNATIANLVVSILNNFLKEGFLGAVLSMVSSVLSFLVIYFVCTGASELLSSKGDVSQADRGQLIWKLCLGCTAVAVVGGILAVVPIVGALGAIATVVAGIVQLVAQILFIIFLYAGSQSLLS